MNENAAFLIFMGLVLNGCFQMTARENINESLIVDERELGQSLKAAACLLSGRDWEYSQCREAEQ